MAACGTVYSATCLEGDVLIMPPGYIIAEKCLNNQVCHGVRYMDLRIVNSRDYQMFLDIFMPASLSECKPNTSQAFLGKILSAQQAAAAESEGGGGFTLSPKLELALQVKQEAKKGNGKGK